MVLVFFLNMSMNLLEVIISNHFLEARRIELLTSSLQSWRSTNWAKPPYTSSVYYLYLSKTFIDIQVTIFEILHIP